MNWSDGSTPTKLPEWYVNDIRLFLCHCYEENHERGDGPR